MIDASVNMYAHFKTTRFLSGGDATDHVQNSCEPQSIRLTVLFVEYGFFYKLLLCIIVCALLFYLVTVPCELKAKNFRSPDEEALILKVGHIS